MPAELTISELLSHQVTHRPHQVAFIDGSQEITFAEFDRLCRKSAAWLADQGIGPGDRVAVWLVNRIEWLTLFFGLARLGASLVAVNTRYRAHELDYILERSRAKMLVLQMNFHKIDFPAVLRDVSYAAAHAVESVVIVGAVDTIPPQVLGKTTLAYDLANIPDGDTSDSSAPDALCSLFTTSGTTGGPKLVMHPQRTITLHSQRTARAYDFEELGARLLAALPFCGVYGFNATLAAFAAGVSSVIMSTFEAAGAAHLINRHQITHVFGSDEMFRQIFAQSSALDPFPSARVFGFASFHPGVIEFGQAAQERGISVRGLYGSSEVQALFSLQPAGLPLLQRVEGGGLPASEDAEVRIRDVDTGDLLPPGVIGAIEIRAPTNFVGYLDNPEATGKAIDHDGFFRTGDIGQLRTDGTFVYQARQGDAMRLGGYLVSPVEIEDVLKNFPGVADVQVVAVDIGPRSRSVAFVITAPDQVLEEADLIAVAAAGMAGFKVPAHIWFIDEFPITQSSNGMKVQRAKLRDMAMERLARA
jgi:fatty-acyl-CoA synthase